MIKKIINIIISVVCLFSLFFNIKFLSIIENKNKEIDKQDKIVVKYKAELEDVYSMKEALTETVTNQNQTISELNQKLNSCEVQLKN
ncbi:MAG: hypothetical protein PUJ51_20325 [Clostridiales bacterium]|jgi:hypothetical protein|nr:hypothetical protein [Clostridiales bacterium]